MMRAADMKPVKPFSVIKALVPPSLRVRSLWADFLCLGRTHLSHLNHWLRPCRAACYLGCVAFWVLAGANRFCVAAWGAASVKVTDLRCEYLAEPLGLDVAQPRLSWRLEASDARARGQRQTAYQVAAASSEKLLAQADLWDSGMVDGDQSVNVVYGGKPLTSGQACCWKVRVKDEHGAVSGWSPAGHWTMGLLAPADWEAKWIGSDQVFVKGQGWPPPDNTMPDPWLRKTFLLPAAPAQAVVYVASVGYHELYVNGQKVGDQVLAPCTTDHLHRARYVTYDIAKHLKAGRNVLGLWLGVSWSIFPPYQSQDKPRSPIALAQADIRLVNGGRLRIVTDETWKTHPSPNTLLGVWDFMHFGGELYDARRELPHWSDATLNDSDWKAASVFHPRLRLSAQKAEANKLLKEVRPVGVREVTNGVYRLDMGVNYAGWFEMQLAGRAGDRVEFAFSERENQPMTHRLHSAYIIGPSGKGTFRNHFNYGVGRWVQIGGLRQKPQLSQARGWLVRTDYRRAGQFECDQPLLNRVYETTLWTFENLSLGSYVVDCPQRERMGYGGDAHATTRTALNNYSLGAFYTKWIEDWRDVQGPDGNLPYTAPTYWGGGGPGWSGFCVTLPWEVYRRYGDTRILEENFPMIQRWLAFLETKSAKDMLARWGGEWDFLGDWLWPGANGVNGDTRETLFFNNCYWLYNLQTAARVAEVLGKTQAADAWRQRARTVRAAVQARFFNPADNSYVNGFPAYLAIALLVELPPADLRPAVWQRLEKEILVHRQGHIHAGITGGAFLFQALLENNRNDLLYAMVSREDYPGWGDMLKRGATTFWEDWECRESCLHSSYLYVGSWFLEGLGGIRHPAAWGFKHFVIEPWLDPQRGPRHVKAHYDSLYGRIATEWTIQGERLRLSVAVPPNTEAKLQLPRLVPGSLRESGQRLSAVLEIKSVPGEGALGALRLEPGKYQFEAVLAPTRAPAGPGAP